MTDQEGSRRPQRKRIKSLTHAALNADVTLENLEGVLSHLLPSLDGLDTSIETLDTQLSNLDMTLTRLNDTISKLDKLTAPLVMMVEQVQTLIERFERIAGIGETMMAPLAATELAVRGAVNKVRKSTGL